MQKALIRAVAACALLALVVGDVGACDRGPVRQFVARVVENRPGILIPKHGGSSTCGTWSPAPAAPSSYHAPTIVVAGYQSAPVTLPSCSDGRCPLPR